MQPVVVASLLIVGNGPSADTPEVAKALDEAEYALRINGFRPGAYLGPRCDIWGSMFDHGWVTPPEGAKQVWWSGHPFCPIQYPDYKYSEVVAKAAVPYTRVAAEELIRELGKYFSPKAPSTGAIMIAMALEDPSWDSIVLAGFDNFNPNTFLHYLGNLAQRRSSDWYAQCGRVASEWHSPEREAAFIAQYLPGGRLKKLHENSDSSSDKSST
jgi:hypothetical protein